MVLASVLSGGMRSITFVQAFQYWLKLTALLVPLVFLLLVWVADGSPSPADPAFDVASQSGSWADPLSGHGTDSAATRSTRRTPSSSRRSSARWACRTWWCASTPTPTAGPRGGRRWWCSSCSGLFYVLPPIYGALGRIYAGDLVAAGRSDALVLELPSRMIGGTARRAPERAC